MARRFVWHNTRKCEVMARCDLDSDSAAWCGSLSSDQYSDKWWGELYDCFMTEGHPHIIVTIDTKHPIRIVDFVSAFTSVSNQFEKFMRDNHPEISGDAQIFVKQVSSGSIIADLIPLATAFGLPGDAVTYLQGASVVSEFVSKYGEKLKAYMAPKGNVEDATNADLKDFMGSVSAIANDPDGRSLIEAAYFVDGKKEIKACVTFNTREARLAIAHIEKHSLELQSRLHALRERVLMVFTQTNVKNPPKEKRSSEKVVIEELSPVEHSLIYASDLAERQIKHEIREADENVFKKGFVVDVMIETKRGRPVAYKLTNLHQVVDLE